MVDSGGSSATKLVLFAALGYAALHFLKGGGAWKTADGTKIVPGMKTAPVGASELVSAGTYRQIAERRPGMTYVQVTSGNLGSVIEFTPTKSGKFTRNVVQEGQALWAEIR